MRTNLPWGVRLLGSWARDRREISVVPFAGLSAFCSHGMGAPYRSNRWHRLGLGRTSVRGILRGQIDRGGDGISWRDTIAEGLDQIGLIGLAEREAV